MVIGMSKAPVELLSDDVAISIGPSSVSKDTKMSVSLPITGVK